MRDCLIDSAIKIVAMAWTAILLFTFGYAFGIDECGRMASPIPPTSGDKAQ